MTHVFRTEDNNAPKGSHHSLYVHNAAFRDGRHVIEVNVDKSKWWDTPIRNLGTYGRTKWENWVVLEHPTERLKFLYRF